MGRPKDMVFVVVASSRVLMEWLAFLGVASQASIRRPLTTGGYCLLVDMCLRRDPASIAISYLQPVLLDLASFLLALLG